VVTNLFAGTVAVATGATNKMTFDNPYNFYLLGSPVPFAGNVTNAVAGTSQGINLTGLPDYSQVLTWDEPSQSYTAFTYIHLGDGVNNWFGADGFTPGACPSLTVGQGFLLYPVDVYTWTQSLPSN
jgi:hypothetical protein